MKLGYSARNGGVAGIGGSLDAGSAAASGKVVFFQGPQPANPQAAPAGSTMLVVMALANPAFGPLAVGTTSIPVAAAGTCIAGGTAQWARFVDRDGGPPYAVGAFDVSVGGPGSEAEIIFDDPTFLLGGTAILTSFTITLPEGPP